MQLRELVGLGDRTFVATDDTLGVMLYELLTGSTTLDKEILGSNALLQVLELIREKDPPRPSNRLNSSSDKSVSEISNQRKLEVAKLRQLLKGDLDGSSWLGLVPAHRVTCPRITVFSRSG